MLFTQSLQLLREIRSSNKRMFIQNISGRMLLGCR